MSAAALRDDPAPDRPRRSELSPYAVALRSRRRPDDPPLTATEALGSLAARLGVTVAFDDSGYDAEFLIVAEDDLDAISTARRRWFYLANDLELPTWPITDLTASPLSRTHAATWRRPPSRGEPTVGPATSKAAPPDSAHPRSGTRLTSPRRTESP